MNGLPALEREAQDTSEQLAFLRVTRNMELLPAAAHELIEVIGLQACINLVASRGGQEFKVPEVIGGESREWKRLVDAVGYDAATKLVERCAGTAVYVPMCKAALREERDRTILQLREDGASLDALGSQFNMTRRHLFRIIKSRRRAKR